MLFTLLVNVMSDFIMLATEDSCEFRRAKVETGRKPLNKMNQSISKS